MVKKFEEQDQFQELAIKHFGEIQNQFGIVFRKLEEHDTRFELIDKKLEEHDTRFDHLEILSRQHHEELELIARQVETQERTDISNAKFYLVKVPE
ncbi:hypothetical protein JT05_01605 [Desulfosporosinus sp. Tol-M]|nr:hypothetical protein JT05_01605 [Desulfosporosinus sp. Tol-M]